MVSQNKGGLLRRFLNAIRLNAMEGIQVPKTHLTNQSLTIVESLTL